MLRPQSFAAMLSLIAGLAAGCSSAPDSSAPDATPPDASTDARPPDAKPGGGDAGVDTAGGEDAPRAAPAPARIGWQESGALALFKTRTFRSQHGTLARIAGDADGGAPDAGAGSGLGPGESIEISAPIFPKVLELYMGEGERYPATQEAREALAHASALTYPALLEHCAPMDPAIERRQPGDPPLTEAEVMATYHAIADCAYREFTVKPYWIPQLVSDVDLCGRELGPGWRLITQADIERLTEADFLLLRDALDAAASGFGGFYFSLQVFVRAADGSIQEGRLDPGIQPRLTPLTYPYGWDARNHYEAGLSLRCLRSTEVIE